MATRWAGPLIAVLIVGGIAAVLLLNLEPTKSRVSPNPGSASGTTPAGPKPNIVPAGFREYPIGEEERNHLRVAAVWLPSVHMEGDPATSGPAVIHLEADVRATEGNPNGFAKDEFVPYLKIDYTITPEGGGPALAGKLIPMVARDGLHYGASVLLPKPGRYRLSYAIQPPSSGGLGRHDDPATGVAPWWAPFSLNFDWDYEGLPATS